MPLLSGRISVLEADPELGQLLTAAELAGARQSARASVLALPGGEWREVTAIPAPGGFGLLVLQGLLLRSTTLLGRTSMELIGREDLIRPWEETDIASLSLETRWSVHQEARLAVLDAQFARGVSPWPSIAAALLNRSARRARRLAFHAAVLDHPRLDVRLLLLFWELAERCGRVGPGGVSISINLTHRTLGRLVRAQRPSVTASLRELARREMLTRPSSGTWLLHGEPDRQLERLLRA